MEAMSLSRNWRWWATGATLIAVLLLNVGLAQVTFAPISVSVSASHSIQAVLPSTSFTLIFNKTMDRTSVERAVHVEPAVALAFEWTGMRGVTFRARDGWLPGTAYTVTLATSAHHLFTGQPLAEPAFWAFQTVPSPHVVEVAPDAGAALDDLRPAIRLRFDRAMDPDSVARHFHLIPETPGRMVWPDPQTAVFEPAPGLVPGTAYTARLEAGAADAQGVPTDATVLWRWRTLDLVRWQWPTPGATGVNLSTLLRLELQFPADHVAVEAAWSLEPSVAGVFGWHGETLVFTPTQALEPDTTYQVGFAGVPVNGAAPVGATTWQFTTRSAVLRTEPPNYGLINNSYDPLVIVFDRPMDTASVQKALNISPPTPGTFTWENNQMTFRPQGEWGSDTHYQVTLARSARAADGSYPLKRDMTWEFTTAHIDRALSFGQGPNAQVVDADGDRVIQLVARQVSRVNLTLYRMTLPQFLDRYSSSFRGVGPQEHKGVSVDGLEAVRQWQSELMPLKGPDAHEITLPLDVPAGLYVLDMSVPNAAGDQLIIILTRRTLVLKQAEGQIVAWAAALADASPVAGLNMRVYARDAKLLAEGTSDAQGLFRTSVPVNPEPLIVIAEGGGDITVSGLSPEWNTNQGWWGWWQPAPKADKYAVHITTDRPIYRPGQTVYVKAVVRRDQDALLSLPAPDTDVVARLRDARDNVIGEQTLRPSAFGGVATQFALAEGGTLGTYHVEVAIGTEVHRQPLKVEEYRKPDFFVTVAVTPTQVVQGDQVTVNVEARTTFGQPMAGAYVQLSGLLMMPPGWRYYYGEGAEGMAQWTVLDGMTYRGQTDEQGRWSLPVTIPNLQQQYFLADEYDGGNAPARLRVEATVSDGSAEPVSGGATVSVHRAGGGLAQSLERHGFKPGEPIVVELWARDVSGTPLAGAEITAGIYAWEWEGQWGGDYTHEVITASVRTDQTGRAQAKLHVDQMGWYQLRSTLTDAQGRRIEQKTWLWVWDPASSAPWYGEGDGLKISADKESYAPGEVARLLIHSPVTGTTALLSFERGTTRRAQVVQLTGPQTTVEVPILPDDVPNIFITVNVWQRPVPQAGQGDWYWYGQSTPEGRLLTASTELTVPASDKHLQVTLTPDRTTYAPRSEMTLTLRTLNGAGQPVPAEVSLAVVDEAIFALSADLTTDPFEAFYGQRENIVRTYDSLRPVRELWAGGMGGGGGDGFSPANPRWNFPDTAYWNPFVVTDADGLAVVRIKLPDSLTTWRIVARAVSGSDTLVGEATAKVAVAQPVIIRPSLPRVLVQGDQATLTAVVQNFSGKPMQAQVWLQAQGLTVSGPITQSLTVPEGGSAVAGWPVAADTLPEARLVFAVKATSTEPPFGPVGQDAVALALPVGPLATRDVQAASGAVGDAVEQTILIPTGILTDVSTLEVSLSRSIANTLLDGLEYLTGFPYGCVEQTMSRALPNAVVGRAFRRLGVSNPQLEADLPARINASLQRLYGYQHNDGGWGWWYDDTSNDYNTAWVIFGLAMTKEAGYTVDAGVIERGAAWINTNYSSMDRRTQAYALYALATAGRGVLTQTQTLAATASDLDPFSRAALAIALHMSGDQAEARRLVDGLIAEAKENETGAWWETGIEDGHYQQKTMASTKRTTALVLDALVRIVPDHPLVPKTALWLMAQRRGHEGGWGTTQETAYAIIALTDYILASQELAAQTTYRLFLNGTLVQEGGLGPGEPAARITVPGRALRAGPNTVRIERQGQGRLYYSVVARTLIGAEALAPAGNIGVAREYLDPQTQKPVTEVRAGDLVEVRLTVQVSDESWYVLIEDPLPGGFAALNDRLGTTSYVARPSWQPEEFGWERNGYNRKEVHDDRVAFFVTRLDRGSTSYTYLMRATTAGAFHILPAQVSLMYVPGAWGRSASDEVTVRPK